MEYTEFAKKVFADANALMDKVDKSVEFRAKQTQTKEWCYGYFAPAIFYNERNLISHISPAIITIDLEMLNFQPVDPETVGRFTGLTDKNGTKIFEGDIIDGLFLHGDRLAAEVTFKDGAFGLEWNRGTVKTFYAFTSICNVAYEIIGNIHDLKGV